MQFSNFQEFIEMGGYAFNVWSVYGMFLIFLTINLYGPLRKNRQIIRDLKRRYALMLKSRQCLLVPARSLTGIRNH